MFDESLANAPLVLVKEHSSKLGQPVRRVVECAKELLHSPTVSATPTRFASSAALNVDAAGSATRSANAWTRSVVSNAGHDEHDVELHESVRRSTLVLGEEHTSELREAHRRITEHAQDRLAISDGECDQILRGVQRDEKRIAGVLVARREEEPSQIGDVLFAHGNAGEPHATDATRRRSASNGRGFGRISSVVKFATTRERDGFSRDETPAARISFPRDPRIKRRRSGVDRKRGGPAGRIPGEGSTGTATAGPPRTRDPDRSRLPGQR